MAYSEANVCNLALTILGLDEISSLDQPHPNAEKCRLIYELERDAILAEFNWSFATGFVELKSLAETVPPGWAYTYQIPGDVIRVQRVHGPTVIDEEGVPFQVAHGGRLYANVGSATAFVTFRVTDTATFPAHFIDVFSTRLAVKLAASIQNVANRMEFATQLYNNAADAAMLADAAQAKPQPQRIPGIDARRGIFDETGGGQWYPYYENL